MSLSTLIAVGARLLLYSVAVVTVGLFALFKPNTTGPRSVLPMKTEKRDSLLYAFYEELRLPNNCLRAAITPSFLWCLFESSLYIRSVTILMPTGETVGYYHEFCQKKVFRYYLFYRVPPNLCRYWPVPAGS